MTLIAMSALLGILSSGPPAADALPAAALRADLDAIVELHEHRCPAPYLRTSRETILSTRDRLKQSIDGPKSRREFLRLVMEMQAAYGVDHLALPVPPEELRAALSGGATLLPFRARPEGDELEVVAVSREFSALEPGDRILRVAGRPAREITAQLERIVPGENPRFRRARIAEEFRPLMWVIGIDHPLIVDVRRHDGSMLGVWIDGVGSDTREAERVGTGASRGSQTPSPETLVDDPPFRCSIVGGDIALIDFPTMNRSFAERWSAFLDRAFAAIADRHAKGVVVDIRRNGGGDSRLGEQLLARLTSKPYRLAGGVQVGSFSDKSWKRENEAPRTRARISPGFDGPACLLIGERTFSSAEMLADGARTFDLMITIGEPTGGAPTSLGELGTSALPGSGLVIPYCQKRFVRASGDENDTGPVTPHHAVPEVPGRDAPLDRAISLLRAWEGPEASKTPADAPSR